MRVLVSGLMAVALWAAAVPAASAQSQMAAWQALPGKVLRCFDLAAQESGQQLSGIIANGYAPQDAVFAQLMQTCEAFAKGLRDRFECTLQDASGANVQTLCEEYYVVQRNGQWVKVEPDEALLIALRGVEPINTWNQELPEGLQRRQASIEIALGLNDGPHDYSSAESPATPAVESAPAETTSPPRAVEPAPPLPEPPRAVALVEPAPATPPPAVAKPAKPPRSDQARSLTERALQLGATRDSWEQLRDEGGINGTFFGLRVLDARATWGDDGILGRLMMLIDPSTAPKAIRSALDRACRFNDAEWDYSADSATTSGSASQDGKSCSYVCAPGVECNVILDVEDWALARPTLMATADATPKAATSGGLDAIVAFDEADADSKCRDEWTRRGELDQRMFDYCASQQLDGFRTLESLYETNADNPSRDAILLANVEKWTERGVTDYRMAAHGSEQEFEAMLDIAFARDNQEAPEALIAACEAKWSAEGRRSRIALGSEFQLTAHCIKEGN